jgi:hypothetical protein
MSSFEQNSIYGSFKLLEVLVEFLAEGSVRTAEAVSTNIRPAAAEAVSTNDRPAAGAWSSLPELLSEDFRDDRLAAAFSSFRAESAEKLDRESALRRREFLRYSSLYDNRGEVLPLEEFCSAF